LEDTFNLEIMMGENYSRRRFITTSAIIGSGLAISPMIIKVGKGSATGNPIRLEHLEKQEEYKLAADYIREVGARAGISFLE